MTLDVTPPDDRDRGALAIAERILGILDEGRFSATYKFAVLAGLMDLCLELAPGAGGAPDTITTRHLAAKVIELYWPHTSAYELAPARVVVLRQGGNNDREQATIVDDIARFRARIAADPGCPLERARRSHPDDWQRLVHDVEWTLIQYPLPRVQRIGTTRDEFLYTIAWDEEVKRRDVTAYQRHDRGDFDNRIQLRPGVGDALVRLHSLLRPLLQQRWAQKVAELNDLPVARLEGFLFGEGRIPLDAVADPLLDLHRGRCFYCDEAITSAGDRRLQVDHFIPWSRHPDNAVENLVPAHARCNLQKRDFLAARDHVERWSDRLATKAKALHAIADRARFEHAPSRVLHVARGIYSRLPEGARLWVRGSQFEAVGAGEQEGWFGGGGSRGA